MGASCPRCGYQPVEAAECPQCGVNVAEFRARLAAAARVPAGREALPSSVQPTAAPPTVPWEPRVAVEGGPAGFWIRTAAYLIDGVILMVFQAILTTIIGVVSAGRPGAAAHMAGMAGAVFGWIAGALYAVLFHWQGGQTLGKMAVRIQVVQVSGEPLSLGQSVGRYFGYFVSALILGIGYLMVAAREDKRALHDLMAGTRVRRLA